MSFDVKFDRGSHLFNKNIQINKTNIYTLLRLLSVLVLF